MSGSPFTGAPATGAPPATVSPAPASDRRVIPPGTPTVRLQKVSVFYGEVIGLSQVDLDLHPGITGIVGPNGSGKTTLMRGLTGLLVPAEGRLEVLGGDPFKDPEIRRRIGLVPATECFHQGLSGRKNLEVGFLSQGIDRQQARENAARALELIGLVDDAHRRYGTWSRGMRQRLKLGLTLVGDTEVVLLDEPFLGVDPPTRRLLRNAIVRLAEAGRTVLVSSHVLHEIEALTDRVGVLAHGRLLGFGRIVEIIRDLRDRHPHRIQIEAEDPRPLAGRLVQGPHIRELRFPQPGVLEFITDRPDLTYREIPRFIAETATVVRRVAPLDHTLEAVFQQVTAGGAKRL